MPNALKSVHDGTASEMHFAAPGQPERVLQIPRASCLRAGDARKMLHSELSFFLASHCGCREGKPKEASLQ